MYTKPESFSIKDQRTLCFDVCWGVLKIRSCGYQGTLGFSDTIEDRGKGGQDHKVSIHGLKSSLVAIPGFLVSDNMWNVRSEVGPLFLEICRSKALENAAGKKPIQLHLLRHSHLYLVSDAVCSLGGREVKPFPWERQLDATRAGEKGRLLPRG